MLRHCFFFLLFGAAFNALGQGADTLRPARLATVSIGSAAFTAGAWALLDRAWYADHARSDLHTFNDGREWAGMDKAGHFWSAYNGGRMGHAMLGWSGVPQRRATVLGGCMGLVFLSGVEVLDGFRTAWGFRVWDMAANAAGAGFFIGQQALWNEQRIGVKFSAHLTPFAAQRPAVLGEGTGERILKDYNGQTVWLSANLAAFGAGGDGFPKWLNVAVGYGAENMITGMPGTSAGEMERFPQIFLSFDADLSRIRTRSRLLRTVLFVLDCIKIPAPALEFRPGRVLAHGVYF